MMKNRYAPLALLLLTTPALAQEPPPPPPLEEAPAPDQARPLPEGLEPEITIRRRGDNVVREYSVDGQVYMVEITPKNGVPYYLIDYDRDGTLESWRNDLDPPTLNQWRILEW